VLCSLVLQYGISYRDLVEMMQERGGEVDTPTIMRWAIVMRLSWIEAYMRQLLERGSKSELNLARIVSRSGASCVSVTEGRPGGRSAQAKRGRLGCLMRARGSRAP
jgi:hypothetical protein